MDRVCPVKQMPIVLELETLSGEYAIVRLSAGAVCPPWANCGDFVSLSRDGDETTIVCLRSQIPSDVTCDDAWVCLKFRATFEFDQAGVLLSAVRPLSEAGIGVFAISTFSRDYLLIKAAAYLRAKELLQASGHSICGAVGSC